jgi:hypothetical protein
LSRCYTVARAAELFCSEGNRYRCFSNARQKNQTTKETTMRKTILAVLGVALIAGSTTQIAFATKHHDIRKAPQFTSEQFRNASAAVVAPPKAPILYSGGWSAPAGH